jgi:hypothetical protein
MNPEDFFACREIRFHEQRYTQFPLLLRLCADFKLSVLQVQPKIFSHLSRKTVPGATEFILATRDETTNDWFRISPGLEDLKTLDDYAKRYEVDILHLQLFGDDIDLSQISDQYYC